MPIYSIIVCIAENGVIGDKGRILWDRKKADYQRFVTLTRDHFVIMGRKTYEDIASRVISKGWSTTGALGKGRTGIVLSRTISTIPGYMTANSLEEVIRICKNETEVFIVGGAEIFQLFLPLISKIYLTLLHTNPKGDTTLLLPKLSQWNAIEHSLHKADPDNEFDFEIYTYIKP